MSKPDSRLHRVLIVATVSRTVRLFLLPHIEALSDLGVEVHVACFGAEDLVGDLSTAGVVLHPLPISRSISDLSGMVRTMAALRRIGASAAFDVIETHTPIASALVRICLHGKGAKIVYFCHGFHFHAETGRVWLAAERMLAKRCEAVIVINSEDQEAAQTRLGFAQDRIFLVPGVGVDVEPLLKQAPTDNPHAVVVVGHLDPNKHPILAVEALAHLPESYTMIFAGDGPEEEALLKRASQLGCSHRITMLGWVDDVAQVMAMASTLVFLSDREGQGLVVIEAVACGLSVVAFSIRGVRDTLAGSDAWQIPTTRTSADVARAIQKASESFPHPRKERERMLRFQTRHAVSAHIAALTQIANSTGLLD